MRHKNQTTGYGRPLTQHQVGAPLTAVSPVEPSNRERDVAAYDKARGALLKKPPHRHQFINGGCKICGALEVEST